MKAQTANTDFVVDNMEKQLSVFPQEKIYVQTDKPYYIAGEKIFFRIFLLNAATNQSVWYSRYVYVELINPVDTVVIRQQIRPEEGLFYGALILPADLPQGNYRMRAYTRYMENMGEQFFYTQPVFIANANALKMKMETEFEFLNDKEVGVSLRFVDATTKKASNPDHIPLRLNNGKTITPKPNKEGWVNVKFNLTENENKKILYVEHGKDIKSFSEYINIPFPDNKLDLTFYPEGGNIIAGQPCKIAVKSLLPDGNSTTINGEIFNSKNEAITKFETLHDGMGYFNLQAEAGEKYYAACTYKDKLLKFDLPEIQTNTYSLKTVWNQERLIVFVNKPKGFSENKLYLFIHSRGNLLYFDEWDFAKNSIIIDKKDLFTGVQHLLLLSEDFQPVSERLVFVNNNDWIEPEISMPKKDYEKRENVKMDIQLSSKTNSIKSNFSISITDDNDVIIDTTTNILTEILLASELKGRINNAAYYFSKNDEKTSKYADLLMLTQGWNRYNIPDILQGNIKTPMIQPETTQSFSGNVTNNFSQPYKKAKITVFSPDVGLLETTDADEKGNFIINNFEYPDSTTYAIQALTRKEKGSVLLHLDDIFYPKVTVPYYFAAKEKEKKNDEIDFMDYIENTNTKYIEGDDVWRLNIDELIVTAKRIETPQPKTFYGFEPNYAITRDDIEKFRAMDVMSLLARLPGLEITNGKVQVIRSKHISFGKEGEPLLIIDGVPMMSSSSDERNPLNINDFVNYDDIEQINLIISIAKLVIYGPKGTHGVIEIITKKGENKKPIEKLNIKTLTPLGYQLPIEFYSPKYDTQETINNKKADVRSTIYWKANVLTDNKNKTSIDFYTADGPATYSTVIEGVSDDGKLIYHRERKTINVK
jgi:hypothetical protein